MNAVLLVFTFTIFWGAGLLFVVQPLFGRLLLPLLGGAPAVWNTCVLFFQATLLAGYGYAHLLSTRLNPVRQLVAHGLLLLVVFASLPIAVPSGATPPADSNPVGWLLWTALLVVGLPFFAVSATSPLLQRWLSLTRHPLARDPYFLYAASNIGSLLALLGYPLFIEPRLGLAEQSSWWTVGYAVLAATVLGCGLLTLWLNRQRDAAEPAPAETDAPSPTAAVTWSQRGGWLVLALVPSSLMLSVTNYITMDLASVPLLWVIPLAIYLVTYSLAFARRVWIVPAGSARVLRLALVLVVVTMALGAREPIGPLIVLHLVGLFAAAMVCHQQLAARRPVPRHLTQFYFWMALGGVLGGVFNALLAPLLFESLVEYPLGLVAVSLLVPAVAGRRASASRVNAGDLAWPAALAVVGGGLVRWVGRLAGETGVQGRWLWWLAVPAAGCCLWFSRHRLRFVLGLVVVLVGGRLLAADKGQRIFDERSFFGIHRVEALDGGALHRLFHGTTVHGIQWRDDPQRESEPLAYYTRSGPLGDIMRSLEAPQLERVALVGLGAGGVSCYAGPGQRWTYYEIDPVVVRVARDPRFFSYLSRTAGETEIILGDARVTLRAAPEGEYGLIVLDAYNSDAIPLHLVTREALALYGSRLRDGGVLAWHITNRHLDLEPVLAALAAEGGWICLVRDELEISPADAANGKAPSRWAVMARRRADLGMLVDKPHWRTAGGQAGVGLWTDDYANLFSVLRWQFP